MELLLSSSLVMLHLQAWLLLIQVTFNRWHPNNTHRNSTNHNRTHQHTKFHLHMLKCHNSSIQWVMIKQNLLQMKWFEMQIQIMINTCKFFIRFFRFRVFTFFSPQKSSVCKYFYINPFLVNVSIWYPLKTSENKEYKMWKFARNRLNLFCGIILNHYGGPYRLETSILIYSANRWTGCYTIRTSVMKELKFLYDNIFITFFFFFLFSILYFTSICNVHLKIYNSSINNMFTH